MKTYLLAAAVITILSSCSKDQHELSSDDLTGTWVNTAAPSDTLVFFNRNGERFISYVVSFNPAVRPTVERRYRLHNNNELIITPEASSSAPALIINTFAWVRTGEEFRLQAIQLYPFMASTLTYFTYQRHH